ncbi:MAG: hypothetical protein U0R49_00960 [Fimbriimonadales bacterium]
MRRFFAFALLLCSASLLSQQSVPKEFTDRKPDVIIEVRAAPTGAQYVTITMVKDGYPADLLQQQCETIGTENGGAIRGLNVEETGTGAMHDGKPMAFLRARFAIDNLVKRETGAVRLIPFARAFAGAPEPFTVTCLAITYLGYAPGPETVSAVASDSATVSGIADKNVPLLEYRVVLKSQIPAEITFPELPNSQPNRPEKPQGMRVPIGLIGIVAGGSAIAGVLVYFALRPRRGGRGNPRAKQ